MLLRLYGIVVAGAVCLVSSSGCATDAGPGRIPPSSRHTSAQVIADVKSTLDCRAETVKDYCAALNRFIQATPVTLSKQRVMLGGVLTAPKEGGPAQEQLQVLYLRAGGGSFSGSNIYRKEAQDDAREEAQVILRSVHSGQAPPADLMLTWFLSRARLEPVEAEERDPSETPSRMKLERSLVHGMRITLFLSDDQRVEVRENAREMLAIQLPGRGESQVKIGVFIKP
ncbi:hypothetical protein JGU66_02210 [Myxococcaceae bacterium JPH2]|nr:hypothetical protein [Myxococcaceae bacterium JPH2]